MFEFEKILKQINNYLWNPDTKVGIVFLALLIGTGLYFTIRLGLPQLRYLISSFKLARKSDENIKLSFFHYLRRLFSGTLGIANIAGISTAIFLGGPGSVLWLWVFGFLGMAIKFGENTLSNRYKTQSEDGSPSSGPINYIANGLGGKWKIFAVLFAVFAVIASFGIGNMVQSNSVAIQFNELFPGVTKIWIGIFLAFISGLVIIGRIKIIEKFLNYLIPIITLLYILFILVVLIVFAKQIPSAFKTIFHSAFNGTSATGGFFGISFTEALRYGFSRAVFSSEAGLGSSSIVNADLKTKEPAVAGFIAQLGPLFNTLIIGTLTGLIIVSSGAWKNKTDVSVTPADFIVYEQPANSLQELRDQSRIYKRGVLRINQGQFVGYGLYFINNTTVLDEPYFVNNNEPFDGAVYLENGRAVRIDIFEGGSLRNGTEEEFSQLRLQGKSLPSAPLLTSEAFKNGFPGGKFIIAIFMIFFAFSTMFAWELYGEKCINYLLGENAVSTYRILFILAIFIGSILSIDIVWNFSDAANMLMAVPNLICLLALSGVAVLLKNNYINGIPFNPDGDTAPCWLKKRKTKK